MMKSDKQTDEKGSPYLKANPLRYNINNNYGQFRKPRECMPSKERDAFIAEHSKAGASTISLRQKNRYIDEFLVFMADEYGVRDVRDITPYHFENYINFLENNKRIKESTRKVKIGIPKVWLQWLLLNGYINQPII